jgi:hypothetical protein
MVAISSECVATTPDTAAPQDEQKRPASGTGKPHDMQKAIDFSV